VSKQPERTPRETVEFLDRYIVGQDDAKKSVAIALRNRWRRMQVPDDLQEEISPKNIIMIGPTGVGKTEIARRIAKLEGAPFLKVEASKFTEVGYVGRDVESIIRDLAEIALGLIKTERAVDVREKAEAQAIERLLDLLVPPQKFETDSHGDLRDGSKLQETFRKKLLAGELDERMVEINLEPSAPATNIEFVPFGGNDQAGMNISDMMSRLMPRQHKPQKVTVAEAKKLLTADESERLINQEDLGFEVVKRVENSGIVFIDEIDKIANKAGGGNQGEVSREGVQRDLLPIVEGSRVNTKYGPILTDHILFIAAGAFHVSKPSDLIPELQGRFPIRVELKSLKKEEFVRILTEPKNSLVRQYIELLKTEQVTLKFTDEAIKTLAALASEVNEQTENIGARRLHSILEKLLEEVSFSAPEIQGQEIEITPVYVQDRLANIVSDRDLSRYIL